MNTWRRRIRLTALVFLAFFPGALKRLGYRWFFGYRIAPGATIGFSLLDAQEVDLGPNSHIGHLNLITRVQSLELGSHAEIGALNIIRGGDRVILGEFSTVLRFNVLNAIPDHDCITRPESVLELGVGAIVVSGHRIDFTDRVSLGRNVIVGGRNSSLWTHNRQQTAPIVIGDFCYLGSEIRVAPGANLAPECILALGSVLSGTLPERGSLVGGVPARVVRPLSEADRILVRRKTRSDIPDALLQ